MNDRYKNPWLHYGFLAAIYGVGLATLVFHTVGHAFGQKTNKAADCRLTGVVQEISVSDQAINPAVIVGKLCDQVKFTNTGIHSHLLALGEHQHHDDYPGFKEELMPAGKSITVTLGETGTFPLHDHLNEAIKGQLVVK